MPPTKKIFKCCSNKTCKNLGVLQPVSAFNRNRSEKSGYYPYCRACQKKVKALSYSNGKTAASKNKRLLHYFLKQKSDKCKETKVEFFPSLYPTEITGLTPRQVTSLHLENVEKYIQSIIPSCCPYTGLELKLYPYKVVSERKKEDWFRAPDKLSLDRIDCLKGYEVGNVEVVSWFWNCLKSNYTTEEAIDLVIKTSKHLEGRLKREKYGI